MRSKLTRQALLVALVGAASFNAPALAMDPDDEQNAVNELFSAIELAKTSDQNTQQDEINLMTRSKVMISSNQNGHEILVHIVNGEISGTLDHHKLDPDQIKREGEKIIILDDDGKQIAVFATTMRGNNHVRSPRMFQRGNGGQEAWVGIRGNDGGRWQALGQNTGPSWRVLGGGLPESMNPPEVMIGLMMGEPGQSLMAHFDLEPGDAIMVTGVIDDLPADEAGLEYGDLIIAIDGDSPATQSSLHEALADLEDGDELELTVIQQGRVEDIELEVMEYDAEAMAAGNGFDQDGPEFFRFNLGNNQLRGLAKLDAQNMHLRAEELAAKLRDHAGAAEDHGEVIRHYFEQLAKQGQANAQNQLRLRIAPQIGERIQGFMLPERLGNNLNLEGRLELLHDDVSELTDELEERLEDRLGRLEEMLERLMDRLDRDDDRGNRRRSGRRGDE